MKLTTCAGISCVAALTMATVAAASIDQKETVRRFLESGPPLVQSYEARRTLEATAENGRMRATLEATVKLQDGRFTYQIVSESGSAILRNYVLERALEEERKTINEGRSGEAALTTTNYRFTPAGIGADGLVQIGMTPHAPAAMLLDGRVLVEPTGELVAVEGKLSQSPSFWTLQVDIERHYAQVAGYRVPNLMRSRARVRVVGTGTFEMRYAYRQINGRMVGGGEYGNPVAPIQRGPHIIPATYRGSVESMRTRS
jgi:hypothetical protein